MLIHRKPECYDESGERNPCSCTVDTHTPSTAAPSVVCVGQIPSVDGDLVATRRVIAVPFLRRDGLRRDSLESLPGKQPLGTDLGGTGKHVRQTLPVRFLYQRLH